MISRILAPAAVVAVAGSLLFCTAGGDRSADRDAGQAWAAFRSIPAVARLTKDLESRSVATSSGRFVVEASHAGLAGQLGARADAAFELRIAGFSDPVRVRRVGATQAAGLTFGGAVVYAEAWPNADVAVFARGSVIEELVDVRAAREPIEYELQAPAAWTITPLGPGVLEVGDASGKGRMRIRADRAWDSDGHPVATRIWAQQHRVFVEPASWDHAPVVLDPSWEPIGAGLVHARTAQTATPLADGTVLVVGGYGGTDAQNDLNDVLASAELFDPTRGAFTSLATSLGTARADHTATPLLDGRVLIAGGVGPSGAALRTVELYDPRSGTFTTGSSTLSVPRMGHTSTRLHDGTVLIVGGAANANGPGSTSVDLFDPSTGQITPLSPGLSVGRVHHTASVLPGGRVVIAGGEPNGDVEVYDPATKTFRDLAAGGASGKLQYPRSGHTAFVDAIDSRVYFAGGVLAGTTTAVPGDEYLDFRGADPGAWAVEQMQSCVEQGGCPPGAGPGCMPVCIGGNASALALPDRVFLLGGEQLESYESDPDAALTYYNGSTSNVVSFALGSPGSIAYDQPSLLQAREGHTAVALRDGSILVAGGFVQSADSPTEVLSSVERFVPDEDTDTYAATLGARRYLHTSTLLPDGRVLVAGGDFASTGGAELPVVPSTGEIYDPQTSSFGTPFQLSDERLDHQAVLLPDGRVLLVGGGPSVGAEIVDPRTSPPTVTGLPNAAPLASCSELTATLLQDGTVLVVGGAASPPSTTSCSSAAYVLDPTALTLVAVGPPVFERQSHAAVRLGDGRVLLVGGSAPTGQPVSTAEIFDPTTRKFSIVSGDTLQYGRIDPSAVLLDPWTVLVAGGLIAPVPTGGCGDFSTPCALQSTEIVRVSSAPGSTQATVNLGPQMTVPRHRHSAVPLADGRIAYVGGDCPVVTSSPEDWSSGGCPLVSFNSELELFDPLEESFAPAEIVSCESPPCETSSTLQGTGEGSAASLLPDGSLLVSGGRDTLAIDATELVDVHTAPPDAFGPVLAPVTMPLQAGSPAVLAGNGFAGIVDRSGGTTTDGYGGVPVMTWVPLLGGPSFVSPVVTWDATRAAWSPPVTTYGGPGFLFASVDGVRSAGTSVVVQPAPTGIACTFAEECASGYCVDGVCCNSACTAACTACSAAVKGQGADGTCESVADGTRDPRGVCMTSTGCGQDGKCAAGACALVPNGTACGPAGATCDAGTCTPGPTPPPKFVCSGDVQVLLPDDETPCAPFTCDPATGKCKHAPCGSNADCASGLACVSGQCVSFSSETPPSPNGCSVGSREAGDATWLALLGVASLARRRRRRDHGSG